MFSSIQKAGGCACQLKITLLVIFYVSDSLSLTLAVDITLKKYVEEVLKPQTLEMLGNGKSSSNIDAMITVDVK